MYNPAIFKAYDIRGLVEGDLSAELAYKLGQAFVEFLRNQDKIKSGVKLVVGQDMRATSPIFAEAVMRGITDGGVDVVDAGLVTTPLFNFACAHYPDNIGGIMVTASHNPAPYNGFKLTLNNGLPVGKFTGMNDLRDMVLTQEFPVLDKKGTVSSYNYLTDYTDRVMSVSGAVDFSNLKTVIDAGNGMAKITIPETVRRINLQAEYLYLEPDGTFPNHEANPLKTETLKDLGEKALATKADFGFALDGDADRVGLVDELGRPVPASALGAIIGLEVLAKHPKALMLYDLRSSRAVKELWEEQGATTAMTPVGHALIKKQMKDTGAVYTSELSLHLYYQDMYDLESPELSLIYFCQALKRFGGTVSELVATVTRYIHSGEMNFEVEDKAEVFKRLREKYKDAQITELDGIAFTYPNYWFNVRESNTEPVIRLNLEVTGVGEDLDVRVEEVKKVIVG